MPQTKKRRFGDWGEEQAVLFLLQKGYHIIERNYRIRSGEIDIIARHAKPHFGGTLCFIEVKTRQHAKEKGTAEWATGAEKRKRIFRTARHYCMQHTIDIDRTPIQFEQVSVYVSSQGRTLCVLLVLPLDEKKEYGGR
ncbi:MAG TPA: YraN family protein [Candidatus Magasanikbacteria bacterium]|nr:MAG: hypothetical protein A3I74_04605 [Candidatus Magasanikbacteria bacterium RIFCSPLOWO2_02_FULL_47_16]OGH79486.1 MAG: hypothetical protein A3C10_01575 [Candidatus Magasanikbacteria bacterium RIFCSPHIGHO2_02_FULL_48_18]OGH83168.1 MAG: hypothetical protein A3G08_04585 [Candidatus Magasanikbacteria bacterium RIFCSPLOWO2_12_FULL_47_9b]HAZ28843.1 YraN family protein [Candidatus Magasanikbacteria bacterium]